MKKKLLFFFLLSVQFYFSQCNSYADCNPNSGLYSANDPNLVEYDNFIVAFHTSVIKDSFGNWKIWGSYAASDGKSSVSSPQYISQTNYPALSGNILKVALGSYTGYAQLIVLTNEGLFVSGEPGTVIPQSIKPTNEFSKITVNGKSDGLPMNVTPEDVKMLFASTDILILTTCSGDVYVLSELPEARGDGYKGNDTTWSRVMENSTTPLTDVIVARGQKGMGYALKKDGTIWSWGNFLVLGYNNYNNYDFVQYATKMALPSGISGIKMIQATTENYQFYTFYILDTNNTVYALGRNNYKQFGFYNPVIQKTWVKSKYPDGSDVNNVAWISANEHDGYQASIGLLTNNGTFYTAGENSGFVIGRDNQTEGYYWGISNGILASDTILHCEVGGHCTAVTKKGSEKYGYVGHRIDGSMGDGTTASVFESQFDFTTTPEISVCGITCNEPIIENNSPVCEDGEAIFTIRSTPNDSISFRLNNEAVKTIFIDNSGKYDVKIPNVLKDQSLQIVSFSNLVCSKTINIISKISITKKVSPTFPTFPTICFGQSYPALPTVSDNGITGTWSPDINSSELLTYTFTPADGQCALPYSVKIPLIDNSNIQVDEIGNNSVRVTVLNGTPPFMYQLIDENGIIITPWQTDDVFSNLITNIYTVQVKTLDSDCIFQYEFLYVNLPNVITPNFDGKNDTLNLNFLNKYPDSKLEIFDKYGNKISSISSKTPNQDYKYFNTGNYWYVFHYGNGKIKTGWILVKKRN